MSMQRERLGSQARSAPAGLRMRARAPTPYLPPCMRLPRQLPPRRPLPPRASSPPSPLLWSRAQRSRCATVEALGWKFQSAFGEI